MNYKLLITDIICYVLLYYLLIAVAPLRAPEPYSKYLYLLIAFSGLQLLFGLLTGRYKGKLSSQGYRRTMGFTLFSSSTSCLLVALFCLYYQPGYSLYVVTTYAVISILAFWLIHSCYFSILYASDPEEIHEVPHREPASVLNPPEELSTAEAKLRESKLSTEKGEAFLRFIKKNVNIASTNTFVGEFHNPEAAAVLETYRYDVIIDLFGLNNLRGINRLFSQVNEKLPDDGIFVGCFTPKSYVKRSILLKYPKGLNWIIYTFFYLYRRVIPKLFLTKRLYYDITMGRNRILTKAEVFGRLYYCGYEIMAEKKVGSEMFFVARRIKNHPAQMKRRYGVIISLNRVGKNGKVFRFYKFRTMHPYSEYLQDYIYKTNNLSEGGKFRHDIRINSVGRFMRRYWIDELPMLLNLIKGDMKLVGVRPLSRQYFSLYSPELQELRTKFKPGLLPPFYVDMPKTLDEIQASEMKYLQSCVQKGAFRTDWTYFWKIVYNILFRHAHSN